jgi:hypothetical protein
MIRMGRGVVVRVRSLLPRRVRRPCCLRCRFNKEVGKLSLSGTPVKSGTPGEDCFFVWSVTSFHPFWGLGFGFCISSVHVNGRARFGSGGKTS